MFTRTRLLRPAPLVVAALLFLPGAASVAAERPVAEPQIGVHPVAIERHHARRDDIARARRVAGRLQGPPPAALVAGAPILDVRGPLVRLSSGDLVTAAGVDANMLRVVLRPNGARIRRESLEQSFVGRGVAHDALSGRIAIAAVSRVLIYDPDTQELVTLTTNGDGEAFGFVNDVFFDDEGLLLIADQGVEPTGKFPRDGRLWEYDPETAELNRLAQRKKLSNPGFLAADSQGRILVVDLEGGRLVSPLLEARWDRVILLKGARRKGGRVVYRREGLQATAFDIGPDDRMWVGSFSEILLVDGKQLEVPCSALDLPFDFATGLVVSDETTALVVDGASTVTARRFIHQVDDACNSEIRARGKRLGGTRGLAMVAVEEPEAEPESR